MRMRTRPQPRPHRILTISSKNTMDETGQATAFDEDPAAAFLAREQDELAGIADETFGLTTDTLGVSIVSFSNLRNFNSLFQGGVAAPTGEGMPTGDDDLFGIGVRPI